MQKTAGKSHRGDTFYSYLYSVSEARELKKHNYLYSIKILIDNYALISCFYNRLYLFPRMVSIHIPL